MKRRLLTIGEAARRLHLSVDKVRQLADDGELKAQRTPGGHRRFPEEAVERYDERQARPPQRATGSTQRASTKPGRATRAIELDHDLPDDIDIFEEWDEPSGQPRPAAAQPLAPVRPMPPPSTVQAPRPAPRDDAARRTAEEAKRKSEEEMKRLHDLKNHGLSQIPYDLPAQWRAKVVEELESYVTTQRLPAWVSWLEQRNLVTGRVQAIVKAYRDQVEEEKQRQRAEGERRQAAVKAKVEAERRVAALISHGMAYANNELNDFDVFDMWEIGPEVEKALREEVKADWSERDVEGLVNDILDEWDDESD